MLVSRLSRTGLFLMLSSLSLAAQSTTPSVKILLPERTRLLQGQLVDLVLEIRNAQAVTSVKVSTGDTDFSSKFSAPVKADLDCLSTPSSNWVTRADLQSFNTTGSVTLTATVIADGATLTDTRTILVRDFTIPSGRSRNIILFIGDAMGTAYRDAARLVSAPSSIPTARTLSGTASSITCSRWTKCPSPVCP